VIPIGLELTSFGWMIPKSGGALGRATESSSGIGEPEFHVLKNEVFEDDPAA
jgi:hypothetical protein